MRWRLTGHANASGRPSNLKPPHSAATARVSVLPFAGGPDEALIAIIPPRAREEVNAAIAREGIPFDINQLKPENLEDLIEHLSDFTVDVDNENAKVRVYCE
jgi:hypothetical protein